MISLLAVAAFSFPKNLGRVNQDAVDFMSFATGGYDRLLGTTRSISYFWMREFIALRIFRARQKACFILLLAAESICDQMRFTLMAMMLMMILEN